MGGPWDTQRKCEDVHLDASCFLNVAAEHPRWCQGTVGGPTT